jgi:hypothetical protein
MESERLLFLIIVFLLNNDVQCFEQVPIVKYLHIGRSSNQTASEGPEPLLENTDFLEVGVGGTDIQPRHCILEVSEDG